MAAALSSASASSDAIRCTASGVSCPPSTWNARPSAVRSPAPCASRCAASIWSHNLVPERGMPTMKTGARSAFVARGASAKARAAEAADVGFNECQMIGGRNRLAAGEQPVRRRPARKCPGRFALARPELGEIVVRHDLMLGYGVRSHHGAPHPSAPRRPTPQRTGRGRPRAEHDANATAARRPGSDRARRAHQVRAYGLGRQVTGATRVIQMRGDHGPMDEASEECIQSVGPVEGPIK